MPRNQANKNMPYKNSDFMSFSTIESIENTTKNTIQIPSGIATMNKYMVNLILNNEVRIMNVMVMDSEIGNQGIDVLIGMDIISNGDFAVSNFEGRTQFSFRLPSQEHVEYHR
ncbi:MAG: hypothetical protein NC092_10370 [Butyrivibrio sp.]|nr:hypothetical protein [Butyrivibrio sp.]